MVIILLGFAGGYRIWYMANNSINLKQSIGIHNAYPQADIHNDSPQVDNTKRSC